MAFAYYRISRENYVHGILWIAIAVYIVLNLFLFMYKLYIDVFFALLFVALGIASFFLDTGDMNALKGITIMFSGAFILTFGTFISELLKNKAKRRSSIFMHTPKVLPMLEYNIETKEMVDSNKEPILFSLFIFFLIMWSFIATGLVKQQFRYIPLSVMGIAICLVFVYGI
jgi:hypothetical protein